MGLRIKTLNGIHHVDRPPNGGWAWVVMLSAFNNMGIGFGIPKTMGVFFYEMREDLKVSNAAISWFLTVIMSVITLSALMGEVLRKRLDERQIVIVGGLLSCVGMVTCSYAPNILLMYVGGISAGLGYGMACLTYMSQLALYFSSYFPLANGITLSGSTLYGIAAPYLAQYLMDLYTWRGALFILGAISLNTCVGGALLRPISVDKVSVEGETLELTEVNRDKQKREMNSTSSFLKKYWLGFGFLFTIILDASVMYIPNIYIVPYAIELNLTETQSVILLSAISIGDFVGRFFAGVIISSSNFISGHLLHVSCGFLWVMSTIQLLPALNSDFLVLALYCSAYGLAFGAISTALFTVVAKYSPPEIASTAFSCFFAVGGIGTLISGALSGAVVDWTGTFVSVFWLTLISMGMAALSGTAFTAIAVIWNGGNIIIDNNHRPA